MATDQTKMKQDENQLEDIKMQLAAETALHLKAVSALIMCAPDPFAMLNFLRPAFPDLNNGEIPPLYVEVATFAQQQRAAKRDNGRAQLN
jgi:hypothetical protein